MQNPPTTANLDSQPDRNVYAPPESLTQGPMRSEYFVKGEFIVCRNPTVLPRRCIKTNSKDEDVTRKTRKFTWCHQLVYVSVLISPLLLLIFLFTLRKKCNIAYGISPEQSRLLRNYNMLGIFGILAGGLIAFVGITTLMEFDWPAFSIAILLVGLALLSTGVVFNYKGAPLRVTKFRDGWFFLKGASPEYLAQVSEDQANERTYKELL